jgi:hypothetical protein
MNDGSGYGCIDSPHGSGSRILKIVLTADEQEIVSVMALGE